MRKLVMIALTLGLFSCSVSPVRAQADGDSPWLEITQELEKGIDTKTPSDIEGTLAARSPGQFWSKLERDAKSSKFPVLWGRSLNFDELMKSEIVNPAILDLLFTKFGVEKREKLVVHAGVEHVYGYLFSNLKTSFGYKRARWVQPDIEMGFNLSKDLMSPLTDRGSLFTNVTYFFGRFAFEGEKAQEKTLSADTFVPEELRNFPYATTKGKRLRERVTLAGGRKIEIRTDFIPFTHVKGANSVLLIYSILDSKLGRPVLISGFPVAQSFMDSALDPKGLGDKQTVKPRYNAFVEGYPTTTVTGVREVLSIHE